MSVGARLKVRLLPPAESPSHSFKLLILGFLLEGGTETYQFLERGNLSQGWIAYYISLGTTILGFYLIFLGLREWRAFQPVPVPRGISSFWRSGTWTAVGLWALGTALTATLGFALGSPAANIAPDWVAWPVGGLVVLGFGNFFNRLRQIAEPVGTTVGLALGWTASIWAMGVASFAGLVVGDRAILFLTEFLSNWSLLISSIAPAIVAMSPLAITYGLLIAKYSIVRMNLDPSSSDYRIPHIHHAYHHTTDHGAERSPTMTKETPGRSINVGKELKEKGLELKNYFKNVEAEMEKWKFSVEETQEGTRIEVHAVALIRHGKGSKSER